MCGMGKTGARVRVRNMGAQLFMYCGKVQISSHGVSLNICPEGRSKIVASALPQ